MIKKVSLAVTFAALLIFAIVIYRWSDERIQRAALEPALRDASSLVDRTLDALQTLQEEKKEIPMRLIDILDADRLRIQTDAKLLRAKVGEPLGEMQKVSLLYIEAAQTLSYRALVRAIRNDISRGPDMENAAAAMISFWRIRSEMQKLGFTQPALADARKLMRHANVPLLIRPESLGLSYETMADLAGGK